MPPEVLRQHWGLSSCGEVNRNPRVHFSLSEAQAVDLLEIGIPLERRAWREEKLELTPLSVHPVSVARLTSLSPRGSGERVPEGRVRGRIPSATEGERATEVSNPGTIRCC